MNNATITTKLLLGALLVGGAALATAGTAAAAEPDSYSYSVTADGPDGQIGTASAPGTREGAVGPAASPDAQIGTASAPGTRGGAIAAQPGSGTLTW